MQEKEGQVLRMSMDEEYIHMVSGAVEIHCLCGRDITSKDEGESGTDEFTMKVTCDGCGKVHTVHASFELQEVLDPPHPAKGEVLCDKCRYCPCDCDGNDPDYPQCFADREAYSEKEGEKQCQRKN